MLILQKYKTPLESFGLQPIELNKISRIQPTHQGNQRGQRRLTIARLTQASTSWAKVASSAHDFIAATSFLPDTPAELMAKMGIETDEMHNTDINSNYMPELA